MSAMSHPGSDSEAGGKLARLGSLHFLALKTGNLLRTCIARKAGMFQSSLDVIRMV